MSRDSTEFHRQFRSCVAILIKDPQQALTDLFDLTAVRLVRLTSAITGDQADAEDAVQAAFVRIATKPHLLARADLPWPYLIRTARNEALRILQKRRTSSLGDHDTQCGDETAELAVQREETAEWVQRILRTLPKPQYEVVILKHWENLTFAEISEVLGKSQNTVASRYRYAMEKLQRNLEPVVEREKNGVPKEKSKTSKTKTATK